ncbi:MAG: MarR family transcriptional regulator [Chloroflexia bacterium]|nr:MarR family transcriptional regulator [Chloroflexia bacterium]
MIERSGVAERVAAFRAFNRFYTEVIGVLREGLLRTPYSLAEARVIFELAQHDDLALTDLRRALALDAGYLSRILARFAADGLITRQRAADDGRRQTIRLTAQGRAAFALLDTRSAEEAQALLGRLGDAEQRRLLGAMRAIRELLADAPRSERFLLRPPEPGDYGWVVQRHGALYADEYGWDASFEALVARIVADFAAGHDAARARAWIAEVDGEPAGCVFCMEKDAGTAQLRLLLVEPRARGLGIGARLIDECIRFARRAGYARLMLWTNDVLVDARRLYERAGFTLGEEEHHRSFGHDLVGQNWWLALRA